MIRYLAFRTLGFTWRYLLLPALAIIGAALGLLIWVGTLLAKPARRLLAACILAFCTPRPIDGHLYSFCFPDEKAHAQA